jgi:hypothetical protein
MSNTRTEKASRSRLDPERRCTISDMRGYFRFSSPLSFFSDNGSVSARKGHPSVGVNRRVSAIPDEAADAVLRGQTPADQSLIRRADTGIPSHTSANGAAGLAHGGPCDAYAVHACPSHSTSDGNLCHHVVRWSKRRRRHGLRRRCNCQRKAGGNDQSEHCCPPMAVPVDLPSPYERPGFGLR